MVTPKQMRPAQRCDILCVLVIESTQHMHNLFHELYDSVITNLINQLRTPVIVDASGKKSQTTKATPCVRLGVVFYGDYYPYSTRTCSTQYFTSNYREFTKAIKAHKFCEGGQLRCAVTDGLVGALEMFDDFAEFDPEAHLANVQQRHAILVSSTPPYMQPCQENVHMRYDGFGLDDVAKRMRELKLSFSLIQERGKRIEQVEGLLDTANISTKPPLELPKAMSPSFSVRLMGIDLQIPPEFAEPVAQLTAIAPAPAPAILPNTQLQPAPQMSAPVHIQPQPQVLTQPQAPPAMQQSQSQPQLVPQKNKADAEAHLAESPMAAKKPKVDPDPASAVVTSPNTDDQPKSARGKGRVKTGNSPGTAATAATSRKASKPLDSPAVSANQIPTTPQSASAGGPANAQQQQHQHALDPNEMEVTPSSETAMSVKSPTGLQQLQQKQQKQQINNGSVEQTAAMMPNIVQQATNPSYAAILADFKSKGASDEDLRLLLVLMMEVQNPARPIPERMDIKRKLEILITKLKNNSAAPDNSATSGIIMQSPQPMDITMAAPAGNTASASQPQAMMSPASQTATLPTNIMQQLLHHTLNLVRMKLNIDIRQVFYALTPETFEAQVREVCRDQPEVLANMNSLKASFIQIKTIQMA
ncbi:hypothetical protein LPJ66_002805, partial [Kickxella alabastrina]